MPKQPDVNAVADGMAKAYVEATGINWAHLHVNHRAGLAAALVAALDLLPVRLGGCHPGDGTSTASRR